MANMKFKDKVIIKKRMLFVFSILFLLFFVIFIRLSYIMIGKSTEYKNIAIEQWVSEVKVDAKRGSILDRNGTELAVSANVYRIDLDMNTIRQTLEDRKLKMEDIAQELSTATDMEKEKVLKILNKTLPSGLPMRSATLMRRVEKDVADKVRALKIRGVIISADTKRYYPNDNFLAHVIGHTRSDGVGLTGIELQYNEELSGVPGMFIAETDNKSKELPYVISEFVEPVQGKDVVLTIDEMIQHFSEKAAEQAMVDNSANAVTIIVSNPQNGEILAMVNKPDYNLNDPWVEGLSYDELQKSWRNRAVNDIFEPGSVFKVITATAAMSENLVSEDDHFICTGSMKVGNRTIHCWKRTGHGDQTFVDILKNSCNIGFMTLGKRLGAEKLTDYIKLFGFGKKTGIDLPGEASAIIKKAENISEVDLATISFGQTNTLTAVQYLQAFNAIANNGKLITPHLMKEIVHYEDNERVVDKKYDNSEEKQIIDGDIAKELRGYLEKVVSEGGGSKAFIDGYHIAGKTGTAQKVIDGRYANQKYIASFAGMAPANDPNGASISIFISIDEPDPSNYYAGQIAAPVAKQLFFDIFNYLAMEPDASQLDVENSMLRDVVIPEVRGLKVNEGTKILKDVNLNYSIEGEGEYITDMSPKPGYSLKEKSEIILYTGNSQNYNKEVVVPNLLGYTEEKATKLLNELGLKADITGSGIVHEQSTEANESVEKGTTIHLLLTEIGD